MTPEQDDRVEGTVAGCELRVFNRQSTIINPKGHSVVFLNSQ